MSLHPPKHNRLTLIVMLAMLLGSTCVMGADLITKEDTISTIDIKDVVTATFSNYTKIYTSDAGVTIETEKVAFRIDGERIKFDIDYTGTKPNRDGWHCTYIKSEKPIKKIRGINYLIDGKDYYFTWFYKKSNCVTQFYEKEAYEDCDYEDKVQLSQITDNALKVCWKPENITDMVYDPLISDWITNVTAYWKFDDNSSHVFQDYAGNVNNHSASRDWGANGYYVSDTPSGEGQAYKFLANGRWKAANAGDLTSLTSGEITMALKGDNNAELRPYFSENGRLALIVRTHRQQITINTDGTDCNLYYFEHASYLDNETWEFATFGFNGTHCYIYNNQTLVRSEAATGTMESGSWLAIAMGNGQPYYGKMDCLSATSNSWLSADAREEAYNDCFGVSGDTPNNGITIDTFTNESQTTTTAILNDTLSEAGRATVEIFRENDCETGTIDTSENVTDGTDHKHYFYGLNSSTTYYAILNVTNGDKTNYSECINFTTLTIPVHAIWDTYWDAQEIRGYGIDMRLNTSNDMTWATYTMYDSEDCSVGGDMTAIKWPNDHNITFYYNTPYDYATRANPDMDENTAYSFKATFNRSATVQNTTDCELEVTENANDGVYVTYFTNISVNQTGVLFDCNTSEGTRANITLYDESYCSTPKYTWNYSAKSINHAPYADGLNESTLYFFACDIGNAKQTNISSCLNVTTTAYPANNGIEVTAFVFSDTNTSVVIEDDLSENGWGTAQYYSDDICTVWVKTDHNITSDTSHQYYFGGLTCGMNYSYKVNVSNGFKTNTTTCYNATLDEDQCNRNTTLCSPDWTNTTPTSVNFTSCQITDTYNINWTWVQYDAIDCNITNTTFYAWNATACNYCTPVNQSYECTNSTYRRYNDSAWPTCCSITGLGGDCINGDTNISWNNIQVIDGTCSTPYLLKFNATEGTKMDYYLMLAGIGLLCAFMLWIAYQSQKSKWWPGVALGLLFFLISLVLMGKVVTEGQQECDLVINETIQTGSNETFYTYQGICINETSKVAINFYRTTMAFAVLVGGLMLIYGVYQGLTFLSESYGKNSKSKKR